MPPILEAQPQSQPTSQSKSQPMVAAPRVRERGHLTLVDWEGVAPSAPAPLRTAPRLPASPLRRTWVDRAYDRAFLVLLAVTALGVAASLVQH